MIESSQGDRLEEGLRAAQVAGEDTMAEQTQSLRQQVLHDMVESIIARLDESPELKAKVMATVRENEARLLTVERKERVFQVFGIELKRTEESVRHRL